MDKGETKYWTSDVSRTQKVLKYHFSFLRTSCLRGAQLVKTFQ